MSIKIFSLNLLAVCAGIMGLCAAPVTEVRVKTLSDLMKEIGPDKTIIVEAGDYIMSPGEITSWENPNLEWLEVFDGKELHIKNTANLTIKGEGKVKILATPRYAFVFNFKNCQNISFDNVVLGHTPSGYCSGGVVLFEQCSNIYLNNCILFGSGTIGIQTLNTSNFKMTGGSVTHCTYGLTYLQNSDNITFDGVGFYNTGEYDLLQISQCQNVVFQGCKFRNNHTGSYFPHLFMIDSSPGIQVKSCQFMNNKTEKFSNDNSSFVITRSKFRKNTFSTPVP